jgi:hypothetical protein
MKDLPLGNHESHITVSAISECLENGIIMLTFHPHTNHKLQPLDGCILGLFKMFYNLASSDWMLSSPGKPISVYGVANLIGLTYPSAFSPFSTQSGFFVTGLLPQISDIFTAD